MKLLVVFSFLLFCTVLLQLARCQKEPKMEGDKKLKVKVKKGFEKKNKRTSVKTKATAHPPSLTAHPPSLTAHPPSLTAHPPSLTAHPPSLTAHPPSLTAHPPSLTAHPPSLTAHPQSLTAASPYLTRVLGKGKFEKVGKTLSVPVGDMLELRCKGSRVQWDVPAYLQEDDEGRLRTVQHERYGVMILTNTSGADTGAYTCYQLYCEDSDCRKEDEKALKVFIFFPDPQELFVPSSDYYEVIQIRSNWPVVLPCQVTTPQAEVTLHREFPPMEVKVDGSEISYHVTRGFTIYRPKAHHAGSLYCVASLGTLRQSSIKYMLIYVHYPAAPPVPVVQASSSAVVVGVNLQLSCTVVGEQGVAVDFTWEYPGHKIGRPLYTQETTQTMQMDGRSRQRSQSVLQVDEVREVDEGTYTCTAHNLRGSNAVSTHVNVQKKRSTNKPHAT